MRVERTGPVLSTLGGKEFYVNSQELQGVLCPSLAAQPSLQDVDGNEDNEVDASGAESLSCVEFPLIRRVLHVLCSVVNLRTAKHSFMAAIATELYGFCTWLGVSFVTGIRTDVLLLRGQVFRQIMSSA